jgi:hypothetical protein
MPNQPNRPYTPEEDEILRAGNAAGESLNTLAKRLGRAPSSVSSHSKLMVPPVLWDRSKTEAAVRAHAADAKARRLALQDRALGQAEKGYDVLEAGKYKRIFKGQYGTESIQEIDFIPPNERRDLAASIAQHVAVSARLAAVDEDPRVGAGRSMLGKLAEDIGGALAVDLRSKLDLTGPDRTDV